MGRVQKLSVRRSGQVKRVLDIGGALQEFQLASAHIQMVGVNRTFVGSGEDGDEHQ